MSKQERDGGAGRSTKGGGGKGLKEMLRIRERGEFTDVEAVRRAICSGYATHLARRMQVSGSFLLTCVTNYSFDSEAEEGNNRGLGR